MAVAPSESRPVDRNRTDTVEVVADRLATFGAAARAAIDESDELGDLDTADLFTEISRSIDKHLWFVEAHHQA